MHEADGSAAPLARASPVSIWYYALPVYRAYELTSRRNFTTSEAPHPALNHAKAPPITLRRKADHPFDVGAGGCRPGLSSRFGRYMLYGAMSLVIGKVLDDL